MTRVVWYSWNESQFDSSIGPTCSCNDQSIGFNFEKPPGEDLRAAVKSSTVTIALWSPRSNTNSELAEEVKFARGKSNVFHALIQSAQAPDAPFRGDKSVNLTGWRGEDEFAPWRELANLVTQKAGVAPLPPPAPKPPSGFFQPGRVAEGAPQPASCVIAGPPATTAAPASATVSAARRSSARRRRSRNEASRSKAPSRKRATACW